VRLSPGSLHGTFDCCDQDIGSDGLAKEEPTFVWLQVPSVRASNNHHGKRACLTFGAQLAVNVESGNTREQQVENHGRRAVGFDLLESIESVWNADGSVSCADERLSVHFSSSGIIFDNQY
jgi:hypothetical protein